MAAASGAAAAAGCSGLGRGPSSGQRILVLGGTNYLGPAIVEVALASGHEVTLFNRGVTRPELFPGIEKLRGLRAADGGDLDALRGERRWDAVIDVWPAQSALVSQTARLLADRADYYFFVSSIAVYRDFSRAGIDESAPVHENDPGWYGGEKALAEKAVAQSFPGRSGVCRCHAILGPRDDGHAYHYWLRRLAREDRVLAPGSGVDPVQYADVRDVARWVVESAVTRRAGTYNVVGAHPPITLRDLLEGSRAALGSNATLIWADADALRREYGVRSFSDMPLWAPLDEDAGFYQIDGRRALRAGVRYRPLADTARDAWRWYRSHFFRDTQFPVGGLGLLREQEVRILDALAAENGAEPSLL